MVFKYIGAPLALWTNMTNHMTQVQALVVFALLIIKYATIDFTSATLTRIAQYSDIVKYNSVSIKHRIFIVCMHSPSTTNINHMMR